MRSYNLFTRFFIAIVFTTITSLAMAAFSAKQAYDADPELLSKIEKKFDIQIHITGMGVSISDDNQRASTQDRWELTAPTKRLIIKSFGGDVALKSTNDKKITVIATGKLNKDKSPRLLEVTESADEIILSEPENAVKNLEIRLEIPVSFAKDLEIMSVSGDISIENLKLNLADLKTVSGEITLNKLDLPNLNIETVSGDTKVHDSKIKSVKGKSVSGELEIENKDSAQTHLNSISGDVKLKLPKTTKFEFKLNSVSGDIKNTHTADAEKNTSKLSVEISTTNGDIEIE
ncbi:MAG: hypothetical protein B7Y39_07080 [Bdellovibrio sp. 28-41-41]|nr:MAG: hypothetical protein B7Y39_07080 [Bdellovibrio sp. 28-41-41]